MPQKEKRSTAQPTPSSAGSGVQPTSAGQRLIETVERRAKNHHTATKLAIVLDEMEQGILDETITVPDLLFALDVASGWARSIDARRASLDPRYGGKVK